MFFFYKNEYGTINFIQVVEVLKQKIDLQSYSFNFASKTTLADTIFLHKLKNMCIYISCSTFRVMKVNIIKHCKGNLRLKRGRVKKKNLVVTVVFKGKNIWVMIFEL